MTEAYYGTETTEPAAAPAQDAGDSPGQDETSLGAGYDDDTAALAAEEQLPARQDSRAATWGDNPEYDEYDESDLGAEYDGDLEALTAGDQLPARQESRAATWGDSPVYDDEADLGAEYDGDLEAITAADQLPARQESRAATWGDSPVYDDETDLGAEYDGDLDALTAEDHTPGTGDDHAVDSGKGDQDQAATGKPADPAAEAPGVSAAVAPEQEDGNVTAPESFLAGASADTSSVAEADAGERPREAQQAEQADALTGLAVQPDDGHADPDTAPEAGPKELKAENEDGSPRTESRTEQQAPSEAEPGSAALSQNVSEMTTGTDGGKTTESGHDQDQHAPSPPDEPAVEDQARLHQLYQDYLKEQRSGRDQGTNVVGDKPSRSPGDTSNLPPTGEKLLETEDDSASHLEKLRQKIYEEAEDVSDITGEYGGTLGQLFEHPPTETHTEVPVAPHYMPSYQEHGVDGGHLATAGLVVGVLGFELFRAINNRVRAWRAR